MKELDRPEEDKLPMFTLITSNEEKLSTAHRHLDPLGVSFLSENIDLIEIQSDSLEEIVISKAQEAFSKAKKPLVVTDHAWSIPALNGFPGPYMRYINKWLSTEDFLALTSRHSNKTIIKTETICYTDGENIKVFSNDFPGIIIDSPTGDGLPTMRVVTLRKDGKTVAQCVEEGIDMADNYTIWENFTSWLAKK